MPLPDDTPLRGLPCAVLDVEATGFDADTSHVIEIAIAHVTLGDAAFPRVAFTSRVRAPVPVPPRITELTGLTDADVADAPTWAEISNQVLGACEGRVVAAYNAPADYRWTRAEFLRAGRVPLAWPWLDLLVIRRAAVEKGPPGRLTQVVEAAGIELEAHGATGDAVAAALVLDQLMRRAFNASSRFTDERGARARWDSYPGEEDEEPAPSVTTLGPFLRWQRSAALYQERDYANYRRREGDRRPPRSDWHEIEGVTPVTWTSPPPTRTCACKAAVTLRVGRDGVVAVRTVAGELHVCPGRPA